MKKYFSLLAVVLAVVFSSCSNDDIEISYGVNVRVNPSGVIAPFTYEMETGELESFSSSYKLRVRVLAYDKDGQLAAADTTFLTNYAGLMNTNMMLPEGEYTLIALTDVVKNSNGNTTFEYWQLTGENQITEARLTHTGYISRQNGIIGFDSQHINITSGTSDVSMNPTPAGALMCIYYANIHTYDDVERYQLNVNRSCDYMAFNSNGDYVTIPENDNNEYSWRVDLLEPQDDYWDDYNNAYSYFFIFPMDNVSFKFAYYTSDSWGYLSNAMTLSPREGDEYLFYLNLNEDGNYAISSSFEKVNNNRSRGTELITEKVSGNRWRIAPMSETHTTKLIQLMK